MKFCKYSSFWLLCLSSFLIVVSEIRAQVTIGSNEQAKKGALLDLKEDGDVNSINSKKGLLLPRVRLADMDNLYPMFESSSAPGTPNDAYNTQQKKEELDALHTGLLVYNVNPCKDVTTGVYSWTGSRWIPIGTKGKTLTPSVTVSALGGGSCLKTEWDESNNTLLVHIPSGADLRSLTSPIKLKIDWNPATVNLVKNSFSTDLIDHPLSEYDPNVTPDPDEYARGGITFSNNNPSGWGNLTGGTGSYTFEVKAMNDPAEDLRIGWGDDYVQYPSGDWKLATPWRSRQNTLEFSVTEDVVCNESTTFKVVLNQTNYHLWIGRKDWDFSQARRVKDGKQYYRFLITTINEAAHSGWLSNVPVGQGWDGNTFNLTTESNSWWKLAKIEPTNYYNSIIGDMRLPLGRFANLNNGLGEFNMGQPPVYESTHSSIINGLNMEPYVYDRPYANDASLFSYSIVPDNKYRTAGRLTLSSDWDCPLYPDILVDLVQCAANFDFDGIPDVGNNPNWSTPGLGTSKVLKHRDQSNNVFYSAEFGSAGRWMITNLAATEYSDGTPLDKYESSQSNFYDLTKTKRSYIYPLSGNPDPAINTHSEAGDIDPLNVPGQGHTGYYKRWYPEYGVLYNWYAATREPIDDISHGPNEGQEFPSDDPSSRIGEYEVERRLETSSGARNGKIQGICPIGWHLPSDRELNTLERFFYNKIRNKELELTQYDTDDVAKIEADLVAGRFSVWDTGWETGASGISRGYDVSEWVNTSNDPSSLKGIEGHIGHGGAMKAVCPPLNMQQYWLHSSKGYSAEPMLGGFNVIPLGRMYMAPTPEWQIAPNDFVNDHPQQVGESLDDYMNRYVSMTGGKKEDWIITFRDYAYDASIWTSSAGGARSAWVRNFQRYTSKVNREIYSMTHMINVRCVKD